MAQPARPNDDVTGNGAGAVIGAGANGVTEEYATVTKSKSEATGTHYQNVNEAENGNAEKKEEAETNLHNENTADSEKLYQNVNEVENGPKNAFENPAYDADKESVVEYVENEMHSSSSSLNPERADPDSPQSGGQDPNPYEFTWK